MVRPWPQLSVLASLIMHDPSATVSSGNHSVSVKMISNSDKLRESNLGELMLQPWPQLNVLVYQTKHDPPATVS